MAKKKDETTPEMVETSKVAATVKGKVLHSFAAGEFIFNIGETFDFEAETAQAFADGGLIEIVKG